MKGMQLSKEYFEEFGKDLIEKNFSEYKSQIAVGLVGEGSECFGYDDEISQDHDFGPGFCIWLPQNTYEEIGEEVECRYNELPKEYLGFVRKETIIGKGRMGVSSIEAFYKKIIGLPRAPIDNMEWLRIPESRFAVATNGQVFCDYKGEFSKIRDIIKFFYPLDVFKKKLAKRILEMAQSGQYNYHRCAKRGDTYASYLACCEFIRSTLSVIYLLNYKYMPFYKWQFRGTRNLTILQDAINNLKKLVSLSDDKIKQKYKIEIIEEICEAIKRELEQQGLTYSGETFLQIHSEELIKSIGDKEIKKMNVMNDMGNIYY